MKLPDTNVLLFAVNKNSPFHAVARQSLDDSVAGAHGVGMAWLALVGFVRLATRSVIMSEPLDPAQALAFVRGWLDHPAVRVLDPGPRHLDIVSRLLLEAGTAGNLTNDAHIAALAIEHQAEVLTFDRDFARFSGLRYQLLS